MKFIEEIKEVIEEYISNEKLTYKVSGEIIVCYYDSEKFLEIHNDGWMYPTNMGSPIDLSKYIESESAYKMFYTSEIMLRGVVLLNNKEE